MTAAAWDDLVRDLSRMKRADLVETALLVAEDRGEHYIVGGPRSMNKDELIGYIAGPHPSRQHAASAS